jgi:tol-pal system protein YbgF
MTRTRSPLVRTIPAALTVAALLMPAAGAVAQESGGFLDNLFNQGQARQPDQQSQPIQQGEAAPPDSSVSGRIGRIENALRKLTGTIEELQHQNRQLQMQLKRLQDDAEYRFQQLGVKGAGPVQQPPAAGAPRGGAPGQRSDVFDPAQHPGAPGAPRTLGSQLPGGMPGQGAVAAAGGNGPIGAPGGRAAGAPLDLNAIAGGALNQPDTEQVTQAGQLPGPPPSDTSATGTQLATLPPSATPKDEYELAYGYVLHKDYALATQTFRDFLQKHPDDALVPDAQYWLGESLFQQQRYRDAAESFLAVSTKYEKSLKAPDALLRLGQSLAALNQNEAACATFAEVGRRYPRASSAVKRGVAQEQKRVHC